MSVIYNIGDNGPAGGIIFYDKGVFSDGWRYMEAAPEAIVDEIFYKTLDARLAGEGGSREFVAQWGYQRGRDNLISGYKESTSVYTSSEIGSGKRNSELILNELRITGELNHASDKWTPPYAALLCSKFSFNGFNDWFLPSKDELNLMYINLRMKGLGSFRTERDKTLDEFAASLNSEGDTKHFYWSSTGTPPPGGGGRDMNAWAQNFINGKHRSMFRQVYCSARAARTF